MPSFVAHAAEDAVRFHSPAGPQDESTTTSTPSHEKPAAGQEISAAAGKAAKAAQSGQATSIPGRSEVKGEVAVARVKQSLAKGAGQAGARIVEYIAIASVCLA